MKIYFDVCCLNRPFDDQTQDRIHLEAEAILAILNHSRMSGWHVIGSDAIDYEIEKMPDHDKRIKVQILSTLHDTHVRVDAGIERRVEMTTQTMSPAVIRKTGLEAVAKKLGPLGMVRFLQQFETGLGDYTKERNQWLKDMDIPDIVKEIKKKR
jgi:hypothetical protein